MILLKEEIISPVHYFTLEVLIVGRKTICSEHAKAKMPVSSTLVIEYCLE